VIAVRLAGTDINLGDVLPIGPSSLQNLQNLSLVHTLSVQAPRYSAHEHLVVGHATSSRDVEVVSFEIGGDAERLWAIFLGLRQIFPVPFLEGLSLSRIKTIDPNCITAIADFLDQHPTSHLPCVYVPSYGKYPFRTVLSAPKV